jgi:hypothetical protein
MAELATPPVRWRHRRTSGVIRQYSGVIRQYSGVIRQYGGVIRQYGDGQSGSSIRVPSFALRDLLNGYQHAA